MKKEIFIMRKEQITVTNNAENKALEGKGMRKHINHYWSREDWL